MPADPRIPLLLDILDRAFSARGWHGTTLRGALRGMTPEQALWRPGPRRHSVWQLMLHAAYWKYAVRRRLADAGRATFPRKPSNWPRVPAKPDLAAWRADVTLLEEEHAALRAVVAGMATAQLDALSPRGVWHNIDQIHGVAAHDLYHTGQIQLVKRLMRK